MSYQDLPLSKKERRAEEALKDRQDGPYWVCSTAVVKFETGTVEQYEPRQANRTIRSISGPFRQRAKAEAFAIRLAGTFSLLQAQIMDLKTLVRSSEDHASPMRQDARRVLGL